MKEITKGNGESNYLLEGQEKIVQPALHILWDQILYLLDSIQGKYSFESYLQIMNDFVDDEILQAQASGLNYTGGHIIFSTEPALADCTVEVELYFTPSETTTYTVKRAARQLPKSKFIRKDVAMLEKELRLEFEVEKPEE